MISDEKSSYQLLFFYLQHDTIYLGDRHAVETARSELAALQVKNDKLTIQVNRVL
jgi:hypothetical protein